LAVVHQLFLFYARNGDLRDLHSFPTRRSSDLFQELIDQILSHLVGDALAELGHQNGKHIGQRRRNDVEDKHQKAVEINLVKVRQDRKSTRLNSSHVSISYAVFCLKKKKKHTIV